MRIGIVSDTHNNLKNVAKIVELFNEASVERVIHTGDITQAKTMDVLAQLDMPLHGVYGNNDEGEMHSLVERCTAHGFDFRMPPYEFTWFQRNIIVAHDPLELEGNVKGNHHIVLHGHTHMYRHEHVQTEAGEQLTFNPGECAGHMKGLNAIGVLDLATLETQVLKF